MSKAGKFFSVVVVIIVVIVGAAAAFVATFDVDKYRGEIADALSRQTGRTVKFGGPIKLAVTQHGIGAAVENVSISNPSWASRPEMADIGKLQLGVALMPLLDKRVIITELDIRNADILLETNAGNEHNWDMKPTEAPTPASGPRGPAAAAAPSGGTMPVGVRVDELSIVNSQLALRDDKNGKMSTFKVEKLTLAPEDRGIGVSLAADFNGSPIKLALKTGASPADLTADAKWPYDADLTYANYHLKAQGDANIGGKTIELNPYELTAGGSSLHGQLMVNLSGAITDMRGTIMGDKLDVADFKMPSSAGDEKAAAPGTTAPEAGAKPLFSTAPLDLGALKSAAATIDIAIDNVTLGKTELKQVSGKIELANGTLDLSPLKAVLADSAVQGDVKLTAGPSAQYTLSFKAPGVDLASLLEMSGAQAFLSGSKGDVEIELSGSGNSLHDMAASTNGHIDITATGGTISSAAAGGIASSLAEIISPGTANPALNCAAARFVVTNGVGKDNGILADSSASTVAGSGGFDLGGETIDMKLDAKPKLVDTKGLTPALQITGPLASPKFGLDTAAAIQNVAGALMKDKKIGGALGGMLGNAGIGGGTSAENSVPAIQTPPDSSQNACLYTLDHKQAPAAAAAAPASGNNAVKGVAGQPVGKGNNIGKQLMQGILGH